MNFHNSIVFIADLHLSPYIKKEIEWNFSKFCRFLVNKKIKTLYILGDLFEFWFEYNHFIFDGYFYVLTDLLYLKENNIEVHFIKGNHDFTIGTFFSKILNLDSIEEKKTITLDGIKVHLQHGDLITRRDFILKLWNNIMRRKLTLYLFRILPPMVITGIINVILSLNRKVSKRGSLKNLSLRDLLVDTSEIEKCDIFICGHLHCTREEILLLANREVKVYIIGKWEKGSYPFLVYNKGEFKFLDFKDYL